MARSGRDKTGERAPRLRLASIVRELLVGGRRTRAELERAFGVTARQMRDDLRALTEDGLVRVVDPGPNQAYELRPELLVRGLPDPDQLAWVVGRQVTRFLAGTELHAEIGERSLEQLVRYVPEPSRTYAPRSAVVADLLVAARRSLCVALTYDAAMGERTYAPFEPKNLLVYKRALYVVGHLGGGVKAYSFAIDRVRGVALGEPFPPRSDWDVEGWLEGRFGLFTDPDHPEPDEISLRFAADAAMYVRERTFHPSQRVEELRDGQIRLTMRATGKELLTFVLEWGPKVVVESPEWLREAVVDELRAALAAYGADGT